MSPLLTIGDGDGGGTGAAAGGGCGAAGGTTNAPGGGVTGGTGCAVAVGAGSALRVILVAPRVSTSTLTTRGERSVNCSRCSTMSVAIASGGTLSSMICSSAAWVTCCDAGRSPEASRTTTFFPASRMIACALNLVRYAT